MDAINLVSDLIKQALSSRASDVHIEPQQCALRVRVRVDGLLLESARLPLAHAPAVISRLKVLGNLDIGERRLPQDGALSVEYEGKRIDLRISTMPTIYGEKVVLRLLRKQSDLATIDQLGMAEAERARFHELLQRSSGLIIVTGPTGSGKTTTLYAMLQQLNQIQNNIVTLEDPVEVQLEGINQVQINPKAGLSFAYALRSLLRQDPNVIMIGEIRDKETADIAIGAALTGHLVLSSLHTPDSLGVITRLLDMGIEPYRVAAALTGVLAQRLIRLLCANCAGQGCSDCNHTGYLGRAGIFEVLPNTLALQQLISNQAPLMRLQEYLRGSGVRSLQQVALEKVQQGLTTLEEAARVVDFAQEEQIQLDC